MGRGWGKGWSRGFGKWGIRRRQNRVGGGGRWGIECWGDGYLDGMVV